MTRCGFETEQDKCTNYNAKNERNNWICLYYRKDFLGPNNGICDQEYHVKAAAGDKQT